MCSKARSSPSDSPSKRATIFRRRMSSSRSTQTSSTPDSPATPATSATSPSAANPINQVESIKDLVADINGGKVDLLIVLGGNPAYDAPADLNFADALKNGKVPLRVHHGLYQNETAELCQWHVSATHELEAWGDARAYDGTVSIIQPLIAPLYSGKSALEFVALLSGQADATGYDLVRAYWQRQHTDADFEQFWRKSLHDGWVEGT